MASCHECGRETDESCERCRRPTCDRSYFEREHLGVCRCCNDEIAATDGLGAEDLRFGEGVEG
jgi:hypothetical protein